MPDSPAKLSSLFIGLGPPASPKSPTPRSPRSFVDGAVGLGIVAAMIGGGAPARLGPILILSARPAASWEKPISREDDDEEMELSESYTCVISHVGGKPVSKRVYFDGGCKGDSLSHCYLCRKDLHGLDIFMYRGDKSFCSIECRSQQILSDEHMEKCESDAMMKTHFDCSLSPCSTPLFLAAGVAAA